MLQLRDLIQSPLFAHFSQDLLNWNSGLVLVTGMDTRPLLGEAIHAPAQVVNGRMLPGGRGVIFRTMIETFLDTHSNSGCLLVTPEKSPTISRHFYRRIRVLNWETTQEQPGRIAEAVGSSPGLIAIDQLEGAGIPAALGAACHGARVIAAMESPFRGAALTQYLIDQRTSLETLKGIKWIVSLARVATLCPACRAQVDPLPTQWAGLQALTSRLNLAWQELAGTQSPVFYDSLGCVRCQYIGRGQDVAAVDLFHPDPNAGPANRQTSILPIEKYLLKLGVDGQLALQDVLEYETTQARLVFHLFHIAERARIEGEAGLGQKLAELESANRVLEQRTQAVFSFQDIGQALITSTNLYDLAAKVCVRASQLCKAEHAVLYYRHAGVKMEIAAACGWQENLVHTELAEERVLTLARSAEPAAFHALPPGIPEDQLQPLKGLPRTGISVSLQTQGECVGVMIVHTDRKTGFKPGEVAMLKAFAN